MSNDLPGATTRIDDTAGPAAAGSKYIAVLAPCSLNADSKPRLWFNPKALVTKHGYCQGVDYAALHMAETKLPVLFVPMAIATAGVIEDVLKTGNTGTSVATVAAAASSLDDYVGSVVVVTGGTTGTDQIVLKYSLDGGVTYKQINLGVALTFVIPYSGATLTLTVGTLIAGDTIITWHSTAPMWDAAGMTLARTELAKQELLTRSWMVLGDLSTDTLAGNIVTEVNAFETVSERYVYARATLVDDPANTVGDQLDTLGTEMSSIANEKRLDLAFGRRRKMSPFSNFMVRRSPAWAASIREYQHDLHIPTWKKTLGPLSGWMLEAADIEHDERTDGGALAKRFTCFRTWGNGPKGVFIAKSVTLASSDSPLSRTHNMAVACLSQTVSQTEGENAVGESLVLNSDGTATTESLAVIKSRVDSALARNLLANVEGEGKRASNVYWTPDGSVDLRVPGARIPCVTSLNLKGTIENIDNTIRVNANE